MAELLRVTLPGDPSTQTLPAYLIDCRIRDRFKFCVNVKN